MDLSTFIVKKNLRKKFLLFKNIYYNIKKLNIYLNLSFFFHLDFRTYEYTKTTGIFYDMKPSTII